jgi:hypothetical protein
MTNKQIMRFLVEYEVRGSWWARLCFTGWLRRQASDYYVWKVARKLKTHKTNTGGSARRILMVTHFRLTRS